MSMRGYHTAGLDAVLTDGTSACAGEIGEAQKIIDRLRKRCATG